MDLSLGCKSYPWNPSAAKVLQGDGIRLWPISVSAYSAASKWFPALSQPLRKPLQWGDFRFIHGSLQGTVDALCRTRLSQASVCFQLTASAWCTWSRGWNKPRGTRPWSGTWSSTRRGSSLSTSSWCRCTRSRLGLPTSLRSPSSSHWRSAWLSWVVWGTWIPGGAAASLLTTSCVSDPLLCQH